MKAPTCCICRRPLTAAEIGGLALPIPDHVNLTCDGPCCRKILENDERSVEREYATRVACHGDTSAHSGGCERLHEIRLQNERGNRHAAEAESLRGRYPSSACRNDPPGRDLTSHRENTPAGQYLTAQCDHGPEQTCYLCSQDPRFGMRASHGMG